MRVCNEFEDKIFDYVDGLLLGSQKKEVEKHFQKCAQCSSIFIEIKKIRSQIHKLKRLKTSADFVTVLRSRISMERSLQRGLLRNWPIRIPLYTAAGALIVIATVIVFQLTKNKTLTGNIAEPRNLVPSLSNQTLSNSNSDLQNLHEKIYFPMDEIKLSGRGVPLSSDKLDDHPSAKSDSVQDSSPTKRIQTVEF